MKVFPNLTAAFSNIAKPVNEDSPIFSQLERLIVVTLKNRMELFVREAPTRAALYQHSLRSIYQVYIASIWNTSQQKRPSVQHLEVGVGTTLQDHGDPCGLLYK